MCVFPKLPFYSKLKRSMGPLSLILSLSDRNIKKKPTLPLFDAYFQRVPSNAVNGLELRHMKTVVLRQHPRDIRQDNNQICPLREMQ